MYIIYISIVQFYIYIYIYKYSTVIVKIIYAFDATSCLFYYILCSSEFSSDFSKCRNLHLIDDIFKLKKKF